MPKITVELEERQVQVLRRISKSLHIPMRSIIQAALDEYIGKHGYMDDKRTPAQLVSDIDRLSRDYAMAIHATRVSLRERLKCKNQSANTTL